MKIKDIAIKIGYVVGGAVSVAGLYLMLGLPSPFNVSSPVDSTTSTTSQTQETVSQKYTLAQVKSHMTENDCWMAIDSVVYDVSGYSTSHPGGRRELLAGCGSEATSLYWSGSAGRHHQRATTILAEYRIGSLTQE